MSKAQLLLICIVFAAATAKTIDVENSIYNVLNGFVEEISSDPEEHTGCLSRMKDIETSLSSVIGLFQNFTQEELMNMIADFTEIVTNVMSVPSACKFSKLWGKFEDIYNEPEILLDRLEKNVDKVGDSISDMKIGILKTDFATIGKSLALLFESLVDFEI